MTERTQVGDYLLTPYDGLWFLDRDGRAVSTIIDMGGGRWRVRTPEGGARTFDPDEIPDDVEDVPRWIAEQITAT